MDSAYHTTLQPTVHGDEIESEGKTMRLGIL